MGGFRGREEASQSRKMEGQGIIWPPHHWLIMKRIYKNTGIIMILGLGKFDINVKSRKTYIKQL